MDAQNNKQMVMECYQLFMKGDIPSLLERCSDDADWIERDSDWIPFAGAHHGKAEIADFFAKFAGGAEPLSFVPRQFIAEGDMVVVAGDATWLAKPTGRSFDSPWVHILTIRDGKIARFEAYNDTAPAERAFRLDQPPPDRLVDRPRI
ncbi:nuclear transport factor 2 family protein [Telluria beijingensis]|uniref:nuclear transport factor 2 family protein n=1 Tax=Telluria beijingensis TaxID=3068633 RepID=UPI0027954A08|nr:nuclear transport factor 2 family protein [Massilia sp. REN29]